MKAKPNLTLSFGPTPRSLDQFNGQKREKFVDNQAATILPISMKLAQFMKGRSIRISVISGTK